ncbi:hypothetical protein SAMD00019534_107370 [Acytostelium subglobosum LB1]|uniref:hypothetical protein n=1 Tax=Acytostelium subglobosum LB1 TaxID=1410327 RepID=UPI0006448393|nr:hypothetical protein SAMD00019534_107370 [Acytostelium subglobosum LB1]GAM27561.1 hypothetical protein SAMD00019534_107370 [Acytostelium subglobosum LB1]|eukprot:XP_012749626.1 hypothetical protein SAMD00019534_107370 [Acytostelium subglobosum LB1]
MMFRNQPIAIIGVGCKLPGDITNIDQFWNIVANGTDCLTNIPTDRWDADTLASKEFKLNNRIGGFINDIDKFDPQFFGMSPKEAAQVDPQQRLILQVAMEALEDAKLSTKQLKGTTTGVFIGSSSSDYQRTMGQSEINQFTTQGCNSSFLSNRLSYFLDIAGPSMTVNTACSSSLVAIHLGANSIWRDECRMAIVGGVNIVSSPLQSLDYGKAGLLSTDPSGRCYSFDERASGYVRAEGAGVLILKNLSDAVKDKDDIHCVIINTATNQNGQTPSGITAPRAVQQEALLNRLLDGANVLPKDIGYFECHGTGTQMGDANELEAIGNAIGKHRDTPLPIGSVKSNIGHLEGASGICGVLRSMASLKMRTLSPMCTKGFATLNPKIPFDKYNLLVPTTTMEWGDDRRLAIVNSFGVGGSNASVLISNYIPNLKASFDLSDGEEAAISASQHMEVFTVSVNVNDPAVMAERVQDMLEYIENEGECISLKDLCYTSTVRTNHLSNRLSFLINSIQDLKEKMESYINDPEVSDSCIIRKESSDASNQFDKKKIAFVCSGQGQQWISMGKELFEGNAVFRSQFIRCSSLFQALSGWSLIDKLFDPRNTEAIHDTWLAQPSIFAVQVGIAAVLKEAGVRPSSIIGHSLGEVVAAHIAGMLTLEDSIKLMWTRSHLQNKTTGTGKMCIVVSSKDDILALADRYGLAGQIVIAGNNSSKSVGISGSNAAMETFMNIMKDEHVAFKPIRINAGFHSYLMDTIKDEFFKLFPNITLSCPKVPFYSTTTGQLIDSSNYQTLGVNYWWSNLRETVMFKEALTELMNREEMDCFLEISAHPIISYFVNHMIRERSTNHVILSTMSRDASNHDTIMSLLSKLYVNGYSTNWEALYRRRRHTALRLPARRWNMDTYWIESAQSMTDRLAMPKRSSLTRRLVSLSPSFEVTMDSSRFKYLADHQIQKVAIVPYAFFLEVVYAAMSELALELPSSNFEVTNFQIQTALEIDAKFNMVMQINFNSKLTHFEIGSISDATSVPVKWTVHATGNITQSNVTELKNTQSSSVNNPFECDNVIDGNEFYAKIVKLGYNYGPSFQALKRCAPKSDNMSQVSEIVLPSTSELNAHTNSDFALLHPSVLDGVFQSCFVPIEQKRQGLWIPQSFDKLTLIPQMVTDIRAPLHSYTTITNHKDKTTFVCDISVAKPDGTVVCQFNNLTMKCIARASSTSESTSATVQLNDQLYSCKWSMSNEGAISHDTTRFNKYVLFADDESSDLTISVVSSLINTHNLTQDQLYIVKQFGDSLTHYVVDTVGNVISVPKTPVAADYIHLFNMFAKTQCHMIILPSFFVDNNTVSAPCTALVEQSYASLLLILQQAMSNEVSGRLTLVTKHGQSIDMADQVDFTQYSLIGMLRVFCNEYTAMHSSMIDLDSATLQSPSVCATLLVDELSRVESKWEVAFRSSKRYTYDFQSQLVLDESIKSTVVAPKDERRYQVEICDNGVISDLSIVETARVSPKDGQVEIKVDITSLNFRDILKTLGRDYDANHIATIGDEFAGVVTAVGNGVSHLTVGDKVFGINMARSMCSHITCDADLVFSIPTNMTSEQACTIPITFLTAWYSIVVQAKLQAGEKILIHSAAGGVGLSAVQIAKHLGAEIFVSVGTKDKVEFMKTIGIAADHILNSRNASFHDDIMRLTNGAGVDVVLNSLSGDLIAKSILSLANYGRFVEIGKKDIYSDSKIGLLPFRNNLSYLAVDVAQMTINRRAYLANLMNKTLLPLFESKSLNPLPLNTFNISNVVQSLRYMSSGNHIGKNLVSWCDINKVAHTVDLPLTLATGATYMFTGLGGLAMTMANKMVQLGAKNLVFVSRNGADTKQKQSFIESLSGVNVCVKKCDLTNENKTRSVFAELIKEGHVIKGVFHTAGLLQDKRLVEQTLSSFNVAFHSKATSALNLHNASIELLEQPLDYFVTFGSAITALGNPGQSNYATGNRLVEALTLHRKQSGLNATCLHLAPIPEIGMSADERITFILNNMGFTPYTSLDAMATGIVECLSVKAKESVVHYCDYKFNKWMSSVPSFRGEMCLNIVESVANMAVDDCEEHHADEVQEDVSNNTQSSAEIEQSLKEIVSNIMEIKLEKVDANANFKDLGLDSLLASELSNSIHKKFSVFVPSLSLLDAKASINTVINKINPSASATTSSSSSKPAGVKKNAQDELVKRTIESIIQSKKPNNEKKPVDLKKHMMLSPTTLQVPSVRVNHAQVVQQNVTLPALSLPTYATPLSFSSPSTPASVSPVSTSPKNVSRPASPREVVTIPVPVTVNHTAPVQRRDNDDDYATAIYAIEPLSAPFATTQKHVFDSYKDHTNELTFMTNVYKNCKIKERYMFVDTKDHMALNAKTTSEKNTMFASIVHKTIVEAGERIIQRNGIDRSKISHVVGVTSTGILAPSIDAVLCRDLNLEPTAGRTMINFMGCGAAVIALRTAAVHAKNRPDTYVLVMAVESSTTNMDIDPNDKGDIVSGCIFSDGCAAALVTCQSKSKLAGKLQVVDDISYLMKDSQDALFMHMGDRGIDLSLRPHLSVAIEKYIKSTMDSFLGAHELDISDMEFWAVHPGGRKILEAVHNGLNLGAEELAESYEVMKWYGNMVSCSALYVLKRVIEKIKNLKAENGKGLQQGIVMAFSPGASIEAMLLRMIN